MSIASAINTTKSILSNTATQTATVSTNTSNTNTEDYNRRTAVTTTNPYSGATTVKLERTEDAALLKQTLSAIADDAGQQALLKGLVSLDAVMGGNESSATPSQYLAALVEALDTYATSPSDVTLAAAAVAAAGDVANSLNQQTSAVQGLRVEADSEISTTVDKLNQLLKDFEKVNDKVKEKISRGEDANDALDTRESLVKQISEIVGVSSTIRDGNDMVLYTSGGITLFETVPRAVTFDASAALDATTDGNAVYIDGVALAQGKGSSTSASGSLQSLLQLRDEVYPTYQEQLDEIARVTIGVFAETDGTNDIAGLFTTKDGSPVDFDTAQIVSGLAGLITVNTNAQTDPTTLRNGNISGVSQNTENASGFSDLLYKYLAGFEETVSFDGNAGSTTSATLLAYSTDSVGWVQEYRSNASSAAESTSAMQMRAKEAYANATGVNLDEELILLLDIEQSYKAATKLLSTIDEMLSALMQAAS
ncbi:flagellar hook-associated protein FlgK [Aliirhizobium smilacinae]|uniref:Flagellar hook-associated protein 1 n=1 Tax=Aliirhizobium smilacinae TaxID=1395944 RepID=A0A5C4XRW9_9HYPH|nr:flagellar hook-associated protein FlgK [Rhizobium smilacinae]TNM66068.1 flagellar hook-associated protein FlgK [Rhizobium smilacinae]